MSVDHDAEVMQAARARRRVALGLTFVLMVIYFGFLGLIAWNKSLLGTQLTPGLSLGLLLGAGVILACWILTWLYVRWANTHYDPLLSRLRSDEGSR
ncbi:MAG: DUF485 domain-containing protein [Gemmatimonadota bacterium]|nr:DUF485 domain-containing protein [Gemmatimonadota bacterium]MDH4347508.1 DUF485 domain-containing protein [Gemmatimonadota bacterium]MDH5284790.1 DUF485 domain-containing protein [Gemmatimonadota bacterium]